MERAEEAAEQARKARFDELELLREKRIRAREQKSKAAAEMQAAQVLMFCRQNVCIRIDFCKCQEEIVRHRLAEIERIRKMNERRCGKTVKRHIRGGMASDHPWCNAGSRTSIGKKRRWRGSRSATVC